MKRKKKTNNQQETRINLPKKNQGEMFGVVLKMLGTDQIKVFCEDQKERNCRIPGKFRKRVWIRTGDIVRIKLWDFQPEKADVIERYIGYKLEAIKKKGYLKNLPV